MPNIIIEKWSALGALYKVLIIAGALLACLYVFDLSTGYVRQVKNYLFDRNQATIEADNKKLEAENAQYRQQIQNYLLEIEKGKIREQALDAEIKKVGGQLENNARITEQALNEVYKEEEVTAQATDAKTRCIRLKGKLLALNISSAKDIDCEKY